MSFTFLQVTQHILQFLLNWPTFLELLHFGLFFQGQSLEDAISVVLFYRPYPDAKPVLWVFACFSWLGSIYLSRLVFVYTSTYLYILFIVGCCEFGCQQQCSWVKHQMLCGVCEYCALDSFDDFCTVYVVRMFTSYASPLILFLHLFPYFSFPLRIDPLRFQARGRKRRPNLGFFSCFSLL